MKARKERKTYSASYDYIKGELTPSAMRGQLTEELGELTAAISKIDRTLGNGNPTPVSYDDANASVAGEIADVLNALEALGYITTSADSLIHTNRDIQTMRNRKLERWCDRIKRNRKNHLHHVSNHTPKPLSRTQFRELALSKGSKHIWILPTAGIPIPAITDFNITLDKAIAVYGGEPYGTFCDESDYGENWVAYLDKPETEYTVCKDS